MLTHATNNFNLNGSKRTDIHGTFSEILILSLLVFFFLGGHYTAYALNAVNEQWYEFDDQYVTEVDQQTVENCEAYVLFYRYL